jgi:hypothetical protein
MRGGSEELLALVQGGAGGGIAQFPPGVVGEGEELLALVQGGAVFLAVALLSFLLVGRGRVGRRGIIVRGSSSWTPPGGPDRGRPPPRCSSR